MNFERNLQIIHKRWTGVELILFFCHDFSKKKEVVFNGSRERKRSGLMNLSKEL